jgi:hypothetical protein
MLYRWTEISNTPQKPGVYAWYYSPELTDFDLQTTIDKVQRLNNEDNEAAASEAVKEFLHNFVFQYFMEEPYHAVLRGSLKPKYEGRIEHKPELSEELIKRIVEDPNRIFTIKQVLEKSAPNFASPLYIGMSENLNSRIKKHKRLIEKYYSQTNGQSTQQQILSDIEDRDRSFAMRVFSRKIPPTRLVIAVNVLEDTAKGYVDIENILNRIHYPLLGRN